MEVPVFSEASLSTQRSREVFVQQIKRELSEYFVVMGISDCEYYSLDEILERARASNIRFNREVIKKVFLSIKPTHMDKCNGRQLKESYLKRRWELQTMLDTCSRELEALEQLRQQAENNLRRGKLGLAEGDGLGCGVQDPPGVSGPGRGDSGVPADLLPVALLEAHSIQELCEGVQAEEGPEDGGSEHVPERAGLSGRAVPAKVQ
ncbi:transmembrane domain-containing protein [Cryptosporidium canis]|uniref:Transmembrane domain-containing protein n=1 Tax=Cryptosporidium canis TaxID=195482 RepID=A0ABQ8PBQ1_9CRYT|nr:transmembrane domain-containing protein [Cryptosporidium canis]